MILKKRKGKVITPADANPWPHEERVAKILARAGYIVEFIPESSIKQADILLNGTEYEIKSPITNKPDKLERVIKRALKQSKNIVYDSSRIKDLEDYKLLRFLTSKARQQRQIGKLILITKTGKIIDIKK